MSEAPKRAVQFRIEIQADTPAELANALYNLSIRAERGEMSAHSVSGGVHSSYEHWLTVADHPTHAEYVQQLNEWIKAVR